MLKLLIVIMILPFVYSCCPTCNKSSTYQQEQLLKEKLNKGQITLDDYEMLLPGIKGIDDDD